MKIEFRHFEGSNTHAWAAFVDDCDEAWVYHTPNMIKSVPYDFSFSILIDGVMQGVCALGRVPRRKGAYLVGPGAALSVPAQNDQIYRALTVKLKNLAVAAGCQGIEFMLSPMAPANAAREFRGTVLHHCHFSNGGHWRRAWELSPGYFSVINLGQDIGAIKRGFSKGNRANVTRCVKLGMGQLVQSGPDAQRSAWDDFVAIHAVTCARRGDLPYSKERYEYLFRLVKSGHMALMNGILNGKCVTSILLATYKESAFYSYGGAFDDARQVGAMAWSQSEAIRWLSEKKYKHYCLGFTIASLEGTYEGGVGDFKKRFGGERWPMLCGDLIPRPLYYFIRQTVPDFLHFGILSSLRFRSPVHEPLKAGSPSPSSTLSNDGTVSKR